MAQELKIVNDVSLHPKEGRPTKFDDALVEKLRIQLEKGLNVSEACHAAGISRGSYYKYLKDVPELIDIFEWAQQAPIIKAKETILRSLDDPEYAWRYLERKKRLEFGENVTQDVTNNNIVVVNAPLDPSKVKPSVLERVIKAKENGTI